MKRHVGRQDNALMGSSGKTRVTRFLYRPPPALALAFRTLRTVRFVSNNVCVKKLPKTRLGQDCFLFFFFSFSLYLEAHLYFRTMNIRASRRITERRSVFRDPNRLETFIESPFPGGARGRERESWVTDGKTMRKVVVGER